ncbi:SRPBCC family protein [Nostoc sp. CHAB 5834]|nr:SRPBCC family protein [Nostoc sp. CHAB 5834]
MQISLLGLALLLSTQTVAQQSNTHFSHTVKTTAAPELIWRIWTDVPGWKEWDEGLKGAELNGSFTALTRGTLLPARGPKSKFVLIEVIPNQTYKTKLPLGALYVKRYLTTQRGETTFTHEVWLTGVTKGVFGRALGRNYRKILPGVMEKIKTIAER